MRSIHPGDQWYWRADFVYALTDQATTLHVKHAAELATWKCNMHVSDRRCCFGRIERCHTWAYGDAKWARVIMGVDSNPRNSDLLTRWTESYWTEL